MEDTTKNPMVINGIEYVPADQVALPVVSEEKSSWRFITSPVFWKLGVVSASAVLLNPNFGSMEWYQILGQFLGFWLGPSALVNRIDRTVDKLSTSGM